MMKNAIERLKKQLKMISNEIEPIHSVILNSAIAELDGVIAHQEFHEQLKSENKRLKKIISQKGRAIIERRAIKGTLKPEQILRCAATAFGVNVYDITGRSRARHFVDARRCAIVALRGDWGGCMTLTDIGKLLGGRDHSSILHLSNKHEGLMSVDRDYRNKVERAASYMLAKAGKQEDAA
jgi:chromosomal replication initiator protein